MILVCTCTLYVVLQCSRHTNDIAGCFTAFQVHAPRRQVGRFPVPRGLAGGLGLTNCRGDLIDLVIIIIHTPVNINVFTL